MTQTVARWLQLVQAIDAFAKIIDIVQPYGYACLRPEDRRHAAKEVGPMSDESVSSDEQPVVSVRGAA